MTADESSDREPVLFHDLSTIIALHYGNPSAKLSGNSQWLFEGAKQRCFKELFRRKSVERILRESEQAGWRLSTAASSSAHCARATGGFGIAAIVGAGIFSTVGQAAFTGGRPIAALCCLSRLPAALRRSAMRKFASMI